ncbi:MAG: TolC family protein [Alphaproteobacteria bacterium]
MLALVPMTVGSAAYADEVDLAKSVFTLDAATEMAIAASPALKASAAMLDAAAGRETQAGLWQNPELEVEVENFAGSGPYDGTGSAEYFAGVSQKFEIGGKRGARKDQASLMRAAASLQVKAMRLDIIRNVHIAYEAVLVEQEALRLARLQEELAGDVLSIVKKRVAAAASSEIQLSKAEVAISTAAIARENAERELAIAKASLASLLGLSHLSLTLDSQHFFDLSPPDGLQVYQTRLEGNPNLRAIGMEASAEEAGIRLAKAKAIPDPSFRVGVRRFNDTDDSAVIAGASIPLPVLNRNQGGIAEAEALYRRRLQNVEDAKRIAQQQLAEAWQNWRTAYSEASRFQSTLIPAAEKAYRLSREGFEKGRFPFLEVLDAQRTLFQARAGHHNALKRYHVSRADVERLATSTGD